MSENQKYCLHAFIEGRVQGVGFRYFTLQIAQDLNLTGWVRNRWDGRVEVLAEGALENLNSFLNKLRRGPLSAEVTHVDYEFLDVQEAFNSFRPRPTA